MRKMRPNFQFKPRLVASGEYDEPSSYYVLDNKLETNKVYLLSISNGNEGGQTLLTLILSTIDLLHYNTLSYKSTNYFETNTISLDVTNMTHLYEITNGGSGFSHSGYIIYVYELFGVSGV